MLGPGAPGELALGELPAGAAAESAQEAKFHQGWSEPVREKIARSLAVVLIASGASVPPSRRSPRRWPRRNGISLGRSQCACGRRCLPASSRSSRSSRPRSLRSAGMRLSPSRCGSNPPCGRAAANERLAAGAFSLRRERLVQLAFRSGARAPGAACRRAAIPRLPPEADRCHRVVRPVRRAGAGAAGGPRSGSRAAVPAVRRGQHLRRPQVRLVVAANAGQAGSAAISAGAGRRPK
jgi:hypothetical protein